MLAKNFRLHFVNRIGVDMDLSSNSANEIITVDLLPWKLANDGSLVYGSEINLTYSATDIANLGFALLGSIDNSVNLYLGVKGIITFLTDDASSLGSVNLYLGESTDDGTTFPSSAPDFVPAEDAILLASLQIDGDGAGYQRSMNFEF
jgi:hypothetical protein